MNGKCETSRDDETNAFFYELETLSFIKPEKETEPPRWLREKIESPRQKTPRKRDCETGELA